MICKICNKEINLSGFGRHLQLMHKTNSKDYYDTYLKKPGEDHCKICNKITPFITLTEGYRKYCCRKCLNKGEDVVAKTKQTMLKKYGVINPGQMDSVKSKVRNTLIEKYGVINPGQIPEVREKVKSTCLEKYGVDNVAKVVEVKEKTKETNLKRYGVENPYQADVVKQKIKKVCKEKYGVEYATQSKEVKNKIKETNLEKYGCASPTQNKDIKEKTKQTCLEKYGGYPMESAEIRKKSEQTCLEKYGKRFITQTDKMKEKATETSLKKYGVPHPMQYHDIRIKTQRKNIVYNDIRFDSSWELAYYLHLKRLGIPFEYQPKTTFQYEYNGKTHVYMPDFKVGDGYVEIKGPQFFENGDVNGKMINPWDRTQDGWSEAKHQCMLRNNVKIITECKEYMHELDGIDYRIVDE